MLNLEHVQIHVVKLEELTVICAPIERCFDLARSVEVHLTGNVHCGEPAVAMAGATSGLLGLGHRVTWRARHFGVWQRLTSDITAMDRPSYFQDTMIRGAFRSMHHDHFFRSLSPDETEMRDVFCFAAPLGILGRLAELAVLRRYMRALLRERNSVIREIAESEAWRKYLGPADEDRDTGRQWTGGPHPRAPLPCSRRYSHRFYAPPGPGAVAHGDVGWPHTRRVGRGTRAQRRVHQSGRAK